ncbi:MAG: hypothetical protein CVV27_14225 [Candidatus Melainabacteria bacterium HGW-Melainabacteria-1]|nr:MAG: hypothetical protein CVV27_14225 [Candidatus Melainabacteria bacterium HGW-Melainabacteria-1]
MSVSAIIPLLRQFRAQQLSAEELHAQLDTVVAFCERKIATLNQTRILPAEQAEWDRFLRPGLELSYQGLIGAARLGQEYARTPTQEIAEGIVYAFAQIDKATQFVESRLGGFSAETRATLQDDLEMIARDASQLKSLQQGQAETTISLFGD